MDSTLPPIQAVYVNAGLTCVTIDVKGSVYQVFVTDSGTIFFATSHTVDGGQSCTELTPEQARPIYNAAVAHRSSSERQKQLDAEDAHLESAYDAQIEMEAADAEAEADASQYDT